MQRAEPTSEKRGGPGGALGLTHEEAAAALPQNRCCFFAAAIIKAGDHRERSSAFIVRNEVLYGAKKSGVYVVTIYSPISFPDFGASRAPRKT